MIVKGDTEIMLFYHDFMRTDHELPFLCNYKSLIYAHAFI